MSNESEIRVRRAEPTDAAALLALLKQLQMESDFFELDIDPEKITISSEAQQIKLINASGTNLILLASLGDKLIGIATIQQIKPETGEVGVAVLNDYQRIGLGTLLVSELINWQQNYSELDHLVLEVKKHNLTALHIYQRLGFKEDSYTTQTIWMKKESED